MNLSLSAGSRAAFCPCRVLLLVLGGCCCLLLLPFIVVCFVCRLSSNLAASPVLPPAACGALAAALRCCSGLGVEASPLPAIACSLLQQWQQHKYGKETTETHQQQLLEGGLPDAAEVELLHCLLMERHFSEQCAA